MLIIPLVIHVVTFAVQLQSSTWGCFSVFLVGSKSNTSSVKLSMAQLSCTTFVKSKECFHSLKSWGSWCLSVQDLAGK